MPLAIIVGVLLDWRMGEPRRGHPLIGFGRMAGWIEARLYRDRHGAGVLAWVLAVVPLVILCAVLDRALHGFSPWLSAAFGAVWLYLALGGCSLAEHAEAVRDALNDADLFEARRKVSYIVSRDTGSLDATQVATAATESVLENGNDAVFGALFWFALLGAPGVVAYRLVNTLDAMWGYRSPRYRHFGWAAARMDDVFNYLPARLTALTYAALGSGRRALRCWRWQAPDWDSPNAGPVMAAGAGALGVQLGGAVPYQGVSAPRLRLGEGDRPDADTIDRAIRLVRRGVCLWLAALLVAVLIFSGTKGLTSA